MVDVVFSKITGHVSIALDASEAAALRTILDLLDRDSTGTKANALANKLDAKLNNLNIGRASFTPSAVKLYPWSTHPQIQGKRFVEDI
jgi:hypothetical protein